ncbi:hypothetical protein GCM10010528_23190 [Gordonia defluvii]|uniref:Uncharacterized protein n=1 Tax=Gordonia defluvii TaxID=283718 RepID=A0ABP6LJX3_9ACTN
MAFPLDVEAGLLEDEAAHYEAQADDREARAAAWYGGGSYAYILSLDRAAEYRKKARQLRRQAASYRSLAKLTGDKTKG